MENRSNPTQTKSGTPFAHILMRANCLAPHEDKSPMSTIDQSRLLQMRHTILNQNSALQRAAGRDGVACTGGASGLSEPVGFGKTMTDALKAVNEQQAMASDMSAAYERGDTHDIVSVMVERQKASLGFEATLQVRNKLLGAYRDIMNMPV
jgi:flagellar hook-basal body complex protein FliE